MCRYVQRSRDLVNNGSFSNNAADNECGCGENAVCEVTPAGPFCICMEDHIANGSSCVLPGTKSRIQRKFH